MSRSTEIGVVESGYNGHTLRYVINAATQMGAAGAPIARLADLLGFASLGDLYRVPGAKDAYNKALLQRIIEVGIALKETACMGNHSAQRFILEFEADWLKRGDEVREDIQRVQAQLMEGLDPEKVLKQLLATDMARLNRLSMNSTEFDRVAERVRENATLLAKLRKEVTVDSVDADMTQARAASEYARLRSTFMHLPDDSLPEHVASQLAALKIQMEIKQRQEGNYSTDSKQRQRTTEQKT
jgi:hypothetical protein